MLLPKAALLAPETGSMGNGTVFLLDTSEPVPIVDLVENLVRLSEQPPWKDALPGDGGVWASGCVTNWSRKVRFLGPSGHDKIIVLRNDGFDPDVFKKALEQPRSVAVRW